MTELDWQGYRHFEGTQSQTGLQLGKSPKLISEAKSASHGIQGNDSLVVIKEMKSYP